MTITTPQPAQQAAEQAISIRQPARLCGCHVWDHFSAQIKFYAYPDAQIMRRTV